METLTATEQSVLAAGGILGGILGAIFTVGLIYIILIIIADWKIFTKAGEAGWKALIPIYNQYILCRIMHVNFWTYYFAPTVAVSIIGAIFGQESNAYVILNSALFIYITILTGIKLGAAFAKSTAFKIGLCIPAVSNIFMLILGFGSSKYALGKSTKA